MDGFNLDGRAGGRDGRTGWRIIPWGARDTFVMGSLQFAMPSFPLLLIMYKMASFSYFHSTASASSSFSSLSLYAVTRRHLIDVASTCYFCNHHHHHHHHHHGHGVVAIHLLWLGSLVTGSVGWKNGVRQAERIGTSRQGWVIGLGWFRRRSTGNCTLGSGLVSGRAFGGKHTSIR
ncbi:uncharacterized protein B0T23DRAFT_721 [Neurospora hispaniola]|uniref:Uncharacterized protein n=1 Tax=Neurospora hispaniola TaxID=588809 RepID=A0AAJ0MUK8_9PEZI|nr:hypothetical protein B0T23DRAFT_721 [Neurospora hispaniola]